MTVEDKKITNVERVRAKIVAGTSGVPKTEEELKALEKQGGVPFHKKDEAELKSLMEQVAEQTIFARKELGEWSLVGRTHGADSPDKLDKLIVTLKNDKHNLKVELDELRSKDSNRTFATPTHVTGGEDAPLKDYTTFIITQEQVTDILVAAEISGDPICVKDIKETLDRVALGAPQPSGLGATSPTTLQEGTPGGEAKATVFGLGDRVQVNGKGASIAYLDWVGVVSSVEKEDASAFYVVDLDEKNPGACLRRFRPECLTLLEAAHVTSRPISEQGFRSGVRARIADKNGKLDWLTHFTIESDLDGEDITIGALGMQGVTAKIRGAHGTNPGLYLAVDTAGVLLWVWRSDFEIVARTFYDLNALSSLGRDQLIRLLRTETQKRHDAEQMDARSCARLKRLEERIQNAFNILGAV